MKLKAVCMWKTDLYRGRNVSESNWGASIKLGVAVARAKLGGWVGGVLQWR